MGLSYIFVAKCSKCGHEQTNIYLGLLGTFVCPQCKSHAFVWKTEDVQ